jgi:hypothetical protein
MFGTMNANSWFRRLLKSERGNVLAIGAAIMPVVIGSAAVGLDTIQMALWKRQLQRSADSAALAGAFALAQNRAPIPAATQQLTDHNHVELFGAPSVQQVVHNGNSDAVRVVLESQRALPFMGFFRGSDPVIQVQATAAFVFQGQYCMVALEEGNVPGITFTGSTDINLGCGVVANSRSSTAIVAGGSATVRATPIGAVGGVPASTAYVQPTKLIPYTAKQDDPYAGLPRTPSPPSNCRQINLNVQPQRTVNVAPSPSTDNQYCMQGADIKGTVNLAPGTYYVNGGVFDLGSQAVLNGTGVTIILTSSTPTNPTSFADINMNGGAVVNLSSPTSGAYKGVLFYQDPRTPFGSSRINGNASSSFEGGLYFPSRELNFNGNAGLTTRCLQMVSRRLVFSGNSSVQNECPTNGGGRAFDANFVRLVA